MDTYRSWGNIKCLVMKKKKKFRRNMSVLEKSIKIYVKLTQVHKSRYFIFWRNFSVDRRDQKLIKFGHFIASSLFCDKHIEIFMTPARCFDRVHAWLTPYLPTKSAPLKILCKTIEGLLCNVSSTWKYSLKRKRYLISILLEILSQYEKVYKLLLEK